MKIWTRGNDFKKKKKEENLCDLEDVHEHPCEVSFNEQNIELCTNFDSCLGTYNEMQENWDQEWITERWIFRIE